jgi:hypothetical protein
MSINVWMLGVMGKDAKDHLPNVTGESNIVGMNVCSVADLQAAPKCAERAIEITAGLIDLARIENKVPHTVPRPTICFDEWNVWDPR